MSAIRYTDHLKINRANVAGNIVLGGNIYYDDGTLLYLDTVNVITGNVDIIEVGNIQNIENADLTGDVGSIGVVGNLTQYTDSIGNLVSNVAILGDVSNIGIFDADLVEAVNGNITTIQEMSGTIANVNGNIDSISSSSGTVGVIQGSVSTINNNGIIEEISGPVTTVRDGAIDGISGNVTTISTGANVGIISGNVADIRAVTNLETISGNVQAITGTISNIGLILSAGTTGAIGSVGTIELLDTATITNYLGNINNANSISIGGGPDPSYPLSVTGDGRISGNLVVGDDVVLNGGRSLIDSLANIEANVQHAIDITDRMTYTHTEGLTMRVARMNVGEPMSGASSQLQLVGGGPDGRAWEIMSSMASPSLIFSSKDGSTNYGTSMSIEDDHIYMRDNVGIGTTSPTAKLDVAGSGVFLGRLAVGSNVVPSADIPLHVTTSHGGYPMVTFENTYPGATDGSIGLVLKNTEQTFQIGAYKPQGLQFRGGGATRMVLSTNGNLGIGTTSPTHKLDVNGNTRLRSTTTIDGALIVNNDASLSSESTSGSASVAMAFKLPGHHQAWSLRKEYGLGVYNYGPNPAWRLMLSHDGKMGVSTATPAATLDVNGDVRCQTTSLVNGTGHTINLSGLPVGMSTFYAISPASIDRDTVIAIFSNAAGAISDGVIQMSCSFAMDHSSSMRGAASVSIRIHNNIIGEVKIIHGFSFDFTITAGTQGTSWRINSTDGPLMAYVVYSTINVIKRS